MISFSKSKFAVLGFVMVAVLLIPANDAFADTTPPVVTVPADMNYNTIDSSGRSISWQEGLVHPFGTEIKVTDDVGIAGGDGYLQCSNSPAVPRSFDDGINMMYDQIFPVGTTIVTCQGTDTSSNTTFQSFDVTINYTPLTINSLEIYEDGSQTRYRVIGDAPPSTNLTFEAASPSGSIDYPGSAGTGNPAYDMDNLVGSTSSLESGTWNLKICAPEYAPYSVVDYASISGVGPYVISGYSHCVEETFTLSISADTTPPTTANFSFESLNISSSGGNMPMNVGETLQITPTVKWEGVLPSGFASGEPVVHGEIKFPDGTVWTSINYPIDAGDLLDGGATITLNTWNEQLYPAGYFGDLWPIGQYTVTFTADTGNAIEETNESDNVITGSFTVSTADTTPPVITIPELTTDQWGNENLELSMSGTTNFPTGSWTLDVTDNVGVADSACWASGGGYGDDSSNPWISSTQSYDFSKITYHPNGKKFPIGPTQINCAAYDAAGNRSESNFRVVVTHDDPTGFVQYIDKPNSFGNTADSTTKIFMSANSAQSLHLLKPIADLLTASNTQGMLARDATRTLMDGALTLDDNPNNFYTGGQYTVGNTGYGIELPKPLADMLTDANMAGIADRVNPTRSWSGNGWSVEISEDVSWLSPLNAMVKICNDQGSCQENHVMKPFADMLNESNLNQAMFERSNMKILDAGGPAASAPESSADTTPPTINFFVNSPFGTVSATPDGGGGFDPLAYIATDSSGYNLKVYVDVSDDTSGAWLNQNASTCSASGIGTVVVDGVGNNPILLSSGPLNGNSGSGDYHYYQFPINDGIVNGHLNYYIITCTATDPTGNSITESFVLTILPESGQPVVPCWSNYCDNIVGTSTDTTPADTGNVQASFTTIIQHFPDGIDGPGSAPMTCVQYENLPAGVEYTALLGPHRYSSFEGANSVFYYDENFQWVSWLSHIDSSDPRFSATGTSNLDFRFCSNGLESGDYKLVAFADGIGNPNDPNVPNMDDLIEFATPVTVADASGDTSNVPTSDESPDCSSIYGYDENGNEIGENGVSINGSPPVPHCVTINMPDDMVVTTTTGNADVTYQITATDNGVPTDQLNCQSYPTTGGWSGGSSADRTVTRNLQNVVAGTYEIYCWMFGTYGPGMDEKPGDGSFTLTVVSDTLDITPPTITVPPNTIMETNSTTIDYTFLVIANDSESIMASGPDCSSPSTTFTTISDPISLAHSLKKYVSWDTFSIGTHTITCSATDFANNTGSASFTVTVTEDTGNVPTSNPQSYTVLVNDMRSGDGATNWDQSLNTGCTSFNPQTCYTPSDITINVGDSVTWILNDPTNNGYTIRGNFGGLQPVYSGNYVGTGGYSGGDGGCDAPGHLGYDMCGISGNDITSWTHTFDTVGTFNYHDWVYQNYPVRPEGVVNVVVSGAPTPVTPEPTPTLDTDLADTTPPVIITDSDMTIFVTNSSKIPVSYATARATDNVGITAQPTCTPSSGSLFSVGEHFVNCSVYDNVGLKGEKSFKITIINTNAEGDNQPPVFTQKQDITTDATISNGATVKFELPKVTDDTAVTSGPTCFADGELIPIVSDESTLEFFFDIGPTTVECIAYDAENNKGATKFTVTVNSQIALPDKILFDVTLSTNTSDYNTEDAVFVTGISTPFTEKSISINVKDQLNELVHREQLIPKLINDVPTGTYEGIIFPTILWDTSGNYTMSATYGDATDSVPFTFEYIQTENNNSNIPTGITLNVNETGYAIGDTISVTSQLTGGTSGQSITIDVKNESGYAEILKPLNTDDSGSISYSFKSQDNWKPGKYSITASAVDPNASGDDPALWDWSTSESIQIVKPLPKITIAPTIATTESGDVIASYKAGEIGYFSTSLLSDSTSNVLVTISVLDAEDTTLGVTFFKSVIGKGDSKIVLGFKIPEDAANGAAKIYVNTYTDWPDQGGIPISSELLSEVNIEGITAAAAAAAAEAAAAEAAAAEAAAAEAAAAEAAELAAAELAAENMIPKFLSVLDVVQTTSSEDGSIVSYELPIATGGVIPSDTICKPASGSKFIIGSTQVKCEATNDFGTGKTFFMVTVNQQIPDQTLSVKVGKNSYDNEEPIFVTGSVGKVTGGTINLQVTDSLNNLVFMKSITPKESGTYSTIIKSNELWRNPGEYTVLTTYGSATAQDTFEFELIEVESFTAELIPTSLSVDTDNSVYVLGDNVFIDMKLLGAGAGESILLDIRDSQNDQVFLQSLNTDSDGIADISYPLEPTQNSGIYSVIASSNVWNFTSTVTFVTVAQIADITIGDVLPTLQDGTVVDSFKIGNLGYFQTPIISNSTSNVLIAVTIFDVENTPLGLAYFESKIVNDAFNITLGLEIPEDAAPGLATVYINTYTDWPDKGGVSILEEQVSFIEIIPSSISDLVVSTNSTLTNSTLTNSTLTNSTLTNSTLTNSTLTNSTLTNSTLTNSTDVSP